MELFDRNKKTIKDIYEQFNEGKLTVDQSYQRRHVWMPQDKVRLMETILMGLIVPEVFFWPASIDPETGNTLTHIVDGQQRISAIVDFIDCKYKLNSKYMLDDGMKNQCGNLTFSELPSEAKTSIWTYKLSVVDIDKSWSMDQIKIMFYRLNLTNCSLNEQEKRNSKSSAFGDKSEALAKNEFWNELRVFSANDARRMKDTEYCCSIYILAQEGIVDQTGSQKVNQYYDDYSEKYDTDDTLTNKIVGAMDIIRTWCNYETISFISKKAQMYTMFCVALRLITDSIDNTDTIKKKIEKFIMSYNLFRNEYEMSFEDERLTMLYESIKKYKLASSEGVNKFQNRMIRYEQLFKNCVISDDDIITTMDQLVELLRAKKSPTSDDVDVFNEGDE